MADPKPTVYLETTIPSYLTARASRDLLIAGHQKVTGDWWRESRHAYDLLVSDVVVTEISQGDPAAANERLDKVRGLPQFVTTPVVRAVAEEYSSFCGCRPTHSRTRFISPSVSSMPWITCSLGIAVISPTLASCVRSRGRMQRGV